MAHVRINLTIQSDGWHSNLVSLRAYKVDEQGMGKQLLLRETLGSEAAHDALHEALSAIMSALQQANEDA